MIQQPPRMRRMNWSLGTAAQASSRIPTTLETATVTSHLRVRAVQWGIFVVVGSHTDPTLFGAAARKPNAVSPPSDYSEIVRGCRNAEEKAWRQFVRAYTPLALTICRKRGVSSSECPEVIDAAFVKVWLHISELRDESRLTSWVATILRRQISSHFKSKDRYRAQTRAAQSTASQDSEDPSNLLMELETAQLVRTAIASLPEKYRALATAMFLQKGHASYDQIAVSLKVPRGSLGPMRQRMLKLLRERLEPVIQNYWDEGNDEPPSPTQLGEAV